MATEEWAEVGAPPPLGAAEVHVWRIGLRRPPDQVAALERLLSPDERARADLFALARYRDRYVVARGTLRTILSGYLGVSAGDLAFAYGQRGKPRIAAEGGGALRFNLSHSDDLAMLAVARAREVGVDVERERSLDHSRIARRMFADGEVAALHGLPSAARQRAFFECWTFKEAYVKALGDGLAIGTRSFEAWDPARRGVGVVRPDGTAAAAVSWTVRALHPPEGYPAAVCAEGADWSLLCRSWAPG